MPPTLSSSSDHSYRDHHSDGDISSSALTTCGDGSGTVGRTVNLSGSLTATVDDGWDQARPINWVSFLCCFDADKGGKRYRTGNRSLFRGTEAVSLRCVLILSRSFLCSLHVPRA